MILETRLEVTSGDEAFTEIDAAVLLASSNIILNLDLEWLSLDTLKAVKSASSLLLGASCHIESGDEALAIVNATVLLADTHILSDLDSALDTLALEAVKGTGSLALEARLEVTCLDEAFSEVKATVLLAFAHLSGHNSCNGATKCE